MYLFYLFTAKHRGESKRNNERKKKSRAKKCNSTCFAPLFSLFPRHISKFYFFFGFLIPTSPLPVEVKNTFM